MEIVIYSKNNCGYCNKAKIKLKKYDPVIKMLDQIEEWKTPPLWSPKSIKSATKIWLALKIR